MTDKEHDAIESFLLAQVGKKYDYIGLFRFLPIVRWFIKSNDNTEKWFCSELVSEACKQAGRELLKKPTEMVQRRNDGTFFTNAPTEIWLVLNQHLELATATKSPILQVGVPPSYLLHVV